MPVMSTAFDAVVLAGGRGSRLGGVDKAVIELDGERLVDRVVGAARANGAKRVIVVGPEGAGSPGVVSVREDPPFTGPLAALAAALPHVCAEWVMLLSCDLVRPVDVCALLAGGAGGFGGLGERGDPVCLGDADHPDGAALRDSEGRAQWLAGVYRVTALRSGLAHLEESGSRDQRARPLEHAPLRLLLGELKLQWIDAPAETTADIDTQRDLDRAQRDRSVT